MTDQTFVVDFDSTLVRVETLDLLAKIVLRDAKDRIKIERKIEQITKLGMDGRLPFTRSLEERLGLLKIHKHHLRQLSRELLKNITPSFERNRWFFKKHASQTYILTGGFREYVLPIAKRFGIAPSHVLANSFIFDRSGWVIGFDKTNPLAQTNGKASALKKLNRKGEVYLIGDGYTDYEARKSKAVTQFLAFTENVKRDRVTRLADHVIGSFDEFLHLNKLPMKHSYPRSKMLALLLEGVHPRAGAILREQGFKVEERPDALSEKELAKILPEVSLLGIRSKTRLTRPVLERGHKLMAVGAFCIGTEQIDVDSCSGNGIIIFNAPYSNTRSVVEAVIGEIIALERRLFESAYQMREGRWIKSAKGAHELRGKKLGIVGYGNIGSQLSVLAEALGLEVFYYDIVEKLALGKAQKCRSMNELLRKVDIVSLHVDGRPANRNLFGEAEFKQMREGALFINFSRGKIVDLAALERALKKGKIGGAGIDVFPEEPKGSHEKLLSPLRRFENVILTPHIGGSTLEAQENIGDFVATRLTEYVNNGSSFGSVNFPQIQLPTLKNAHRLLHVHANVPGILAEINHALASHHINILGQYLKTNEQIGYVITDVNKRYNQDVIGELRRIHHTIRFRVLY